MSNNVYIMIAKTSMCYKKDTYLLSSSVTCLKLP